MPIEPRPPLHAQAADPGPGPRTSAELKEFHTQVGKLPDEEREVFDLIFYLGLEQAEVAKRLGVSVPTVRRRWRAAKERLHDLLGGVPDA